MKTDVPHTPRTQVPSPWPEEFYDCSFGSRTVEICDTRIRTPDELELQTTNWGGPKNQFTILLAHGLAHTRAVFAPSAGAFSEYHETISYDLRGHGESDCTPTGTYNHGQFESDQMLVSTQTHADGIILVGASMSGLHSIGVAAKNPEHIRGLVLVDVLPSAKEKLRAIFVNHMAHLSFSSEEERRVHIHKNFPCFSPQGVSNESFLLYPDALFQTTQEGTFIPNTDSGIFNIQEPRDFEPYWEDLAKVQCPVLLLIGGRGSLLETDAIERFLRLSSHFRSETIPGARHSIHLDQPRAFAAATLQFIDTDCSD